MITTNSMKKGVLRFVCSNANKTIDDRNNQND